MYNTFKKVVLVKSLLDYHCDKFSNVLLIFIDFNGREGVCVYVFGILIIAFNI